MTRRRHRGVVTLDTLIEAARKVKRPNLRQLRRNGEVPKGEMVELLAEASEVPVDEIRSVGQEALWITDPARTYEESAWFTSMTEKMASMGLALLDHAAIPSGAVS